MEAQASDLGIMNNLLESAPKLRSFPSPKDAEYAKKQGYGYGDPSEGYMSGATQRTSNANLGMAPREFINKAHESTPGSGTPKSGLDNTRAALAVNRNPIAALGFDLSAFVNTPKLKNANIGGAYNETMDRGVASSPYTLAHEIVHRGLSILPKEAIPEKFRTPLAQELLTRYIVYRDMGDPDATDPNAYRPMRDEAITFFERGKNAKENQAALATLEKAASQMIKQKRPPRFAR